MRLLKTFTPPSRMVLTNHWVECTHCGWVGHPICPWSWERLGQASDPETRTVDEDKRECSFCGCRDLKDRDEENPKIEGFREDKDLEAKLIDLDPDWERKFPDMDSAARFYSLL